MAVTTGEMTMNMIYHHLLRSQNQQDLDNQGKQFKALRNRNLLSWKPRIIMAIYLHYLGLMILHLERE
jgi:hypothetical protein